MIVGYLPYSDDKIRSADLSSLKIISVWSSALADGRTTPRRWPHHSSPMAAPLLAADEAPGLTPARCTRWTRRTARRSCLRLPPHRLLVQIYFGRVPGTSGTVTSQDGSQQMQLSRLTSRRTAALRRVRVREECHACTENPRPCLLRLRQGRASMCCTSSCSKRTPRTRMQYQRLAVEGCGICDRGM